WLGMRGPVFSIAGRRFSFACSSLRACRRWVALVLAEPMLLRAGVVGDAGAVFAAPLGFASLFLLEVFSAPVAFAAARCGFFAGCSRPLLSRRVSNLDTSPFASISARTVPTVVGLA